MIEAPFLTRQERFATVGSTNDVVRGWLADGTPEVCLAVADEQTAGRGREGRSWLAPAGRALLLSVGFRPTWLEPDRVWRLAGTVSLAMADAAEEVAFLPDRSIRLKWPNDLVVEADGSPRKLAGVLGETEGLGGGDPRAVVGIGINADWAAAEFPPELAPAMTSLRVASGGRPIDLALLLDAFTARLEVRIEALRAGRFDVADWIDRQLTNERLVRIEHHGGRSEVVRALRADPVGGGLVVEDPDAAGGERTVYSGDVFHVRLDEAV
ncbi:MAG TPA: biotin--[acetyl-CoA-carboxylase] ligase [Candidatus Limnocylindrales bacterium]|nr:biotin--[acetyl-CoA-carboxylase] ligase [Candidatus Limnocylindrales bacterium]